jgi:hypothetical protein
LWRIPTNNQSNRKESGAEELNEEE